MVQIIECYGKDVPFGSYLEEDLYDNNTLILKKGIFVDSKLKDKLNNYMRKLKVSIEVPDVVREEVEHGTSVEDDNALVFEDDIKERALQGVAYMYSNSDSADAVTAAHDISSLITRTVSNSPAINISLKELKISDEYTFKHCVDVATMGTLVGQKLKLRKSDIQDIATAGILHDIGKVKIPNEILNKPGKLTPEEFKVIQQHPVFGYDLLKDRLDISETTKYGVLMHHEKVDGTGYPLKIKSDRIHFAGKLLSVVDVYDALVTKRPYRKDLIEPAQALEMMMAMSNQFDITILRAFLDCIVIYPIGTILILSDGLTYKVIGQNTGYPLRPIVSNIITNEKIDLLHDKKYLSLTISREFR